MSRSGLRNAERRAEQRARDLARTQSKQAFLRLGCSPSADGDAQRPAAGGSLVDASALPASCASPREAWVSWLAPVFADNQSCYFTGTYSDEYGIPNGLMAARNVFKDFTRFLDSFGFDGRYIVGVEHHAYRDILHLHGILEGPFTAEQLRWVKQHWQLDRGFARSLPVLDGCASYVTKYALKGDTDYFEWRLS